MENKKCGNHRPSKHRLPQFTTESRFLYNNIIIQISFSVNNQKGNFIMEKLMKFENTKGAIYPAKDRIDKNAEKAEIQPCVRNVHKYITESQIYDLMLETRTDKCRAFRKWLTNEVLPEINRNGTYTIPTQGKQLRLDEKPYEYFDKTYKGEPVLYLADISHMIGVSRDTLRCFLKKNSVHGKDYHLLKSFKITSFKLENPEVSKTLKHIMVVTRSGFELICKAYRIKMETPALFLDTAVPIPKSQKTKEERAEEMFDKIDNYIEVRIKEKIDTLFKAAFR